MAGTTRAGISGESLAEGMERRKEHPPLTSRYGSKTLAIPGISAKPVNPDDGLPVAIRHPPA
jgi:hypothetical protein